MIKIFLILSTAPKKKLMKWWNSAWWNSTKYALLQQHKNISAPQNDWAQNPKPTEQTLKPYSIW